MYVKESEIKVHAELVTTVRLISVDRSVLGRETATIELEGQPHTFRVGEHADITLEFDRSMGQNL
jgi:hypothetical protein